MSNAAFSDSSFDTELAIDRHAVVRRGLLEHLPSLRAHARRCVGARPGADDLVQDTAVRALAFAWSFEPGTNVKAWLHQILDSVFITHWRRRGRERRALDALVQDPLSWAQLEPLRPSEELSPPVEAALTALPPAFREVVRLVAVEQRSYKDAASLLELPLGTVMSRLHRARKLLATALGDRAETTTQAAPLRAA